MAVTAKTCPEATFQGRQDRGNWENKHWWKQCQRAHVGQCIPNLTSNSINYFNFAQPQKTQKDLLFTEHEENKEPDNSSKKIWYSQGSTFTPASQTRQPFFVSISASTWHILLWWASFLTGLWNNYTTQAEQELHTLHRPHKTVTN